MSIAIAPQYIPGTRPDGSAVSADSSAPPITASDFPEPCGFKDRKTTFACPLGQGYTCIFNTDIYAVVCCKSGNC